MALLHVVIHPLQSLFVLLHALLQVLLSLLNLLEYARVRNLFGLLEIISHLVLYIEYQGVLVPDALLVLGLDQSVRCVVASNASQNLLNISLLNAISLFLNYLELLHQILVVIHGLIEAHFHPLGVFHQRLVLRID